MKILFVASEAFPLAKVGGLGDVTSSLAIALHKLGHEPCLILPKYRSIKTPLEEIQGKDFSVDFMGHRQQIALLMTRLRNRVPVYFVASDTFSRADEIYGRGELERFLFFSLTVPAAISQLGIHPDIVHCHDWHTALLPLWLREAKMALPCVFTIHNLAYQGLFDRDFLLRYGLSPLWQRHIPLEGPRLPLSFLSQGIMLADILTTVSPTYASEILTPQHGEGLEELLDYRRMDLYGILNGIDYDEFNPATDACLEANYDSLVIEGRVHNKLALQRKSGLPEDEEVPLFGMVSRLDDQKGIGLLLQAIDPFVEETRAQLVILGEGREPYHRSLVEAASRHPGRLSVTIARDERLARLIYAGSDVFLMPSQFEPCGLGQLIAMRYGAIPLVRHTGGLIDTVRDVAELSGNGFVFRNYAASEMMESVKRAEATFYKRGEWQHLIRRNMKLDFSWKTSASKYEEVYLRARKTSRIREY
jgi:starch synthase